MTKPAFSDDPEHDRPAVYRNLSTTMIGILVVGLLAVLMALALRPEEPSGQGESHPAVGQAMGKFELTPLVGDPTPISLESLRGDVVLINFWGTWCGPCRLEFPHLVELNDRMKRNKRFRFISVTCGPGGADVEAEQLRAATEDYLAKFNTELNVYYDPGAGARMSLVNSAQLSGFAYPTTVLLDRDGTIQGLWQGYAPGVEAEMENIIKRLLKS